MSFCLDKMPDFVAAEVDAAESRVRVRCDEYHRHTHDCVTGSEEDRAILYLADALSEANDVILSVVRKLRVKGVRV